MVRAPTVSTGEWYPRLESLGSFLAGAGVVEVATECDLELMFAKEIQ